MTAPRHLGVTPVRRQPGHLFGPVSGHDAVVLASDDERGRRDLGQDALDAVLEHRPEVRDVPARAGLRVRDDPDSEHLRIHEGDVLQEPHRLHGEGAFAGIHGRPDQHEPIDELGMPRGRLGDHLRAGRVPDEHRAVDALGDEQSREQFAGLGYAQRFAGLGCVAEPRQVERVHGAGGFEGVRERIPVLVRHAEAVHQHVVGATWQSRLMDDHHVFAAAELTGVRHDRSLGAAVAWRRDRADWLHEEVAWRSSRARGHCRR